MVLHTVNKVAVLERCLSLASAADSVLLIEDGVYAVLDFPGGALSDSTAGHAPNLLALEPDLAARGISDKMRPPFSAVSRKQFVALTLEHDKVVSWG